MKKLIFFTALSIGLGSRLYAQLNFTFEQWKNATVTERTFTFYNVQANIKDVIWLRNNDKMILELDSVQDYKRLYRLDTVLAQFLQDIAFYKDSLDNNNAGNVRIDYVLDDSKDFKQIRFIKHKPVGDIFVNKNGETSILKMEQDTVNIIMHIKTKEFIGLPCVVNVMLVLNNYTDVDKIIADKDVLQHAFDTLASVRSAKEISNPFKYPSSCVYKPYSKDKFPYFFKYAGLIDNESTIFAHSRSGIQMNASLGAGLVRNTFAPMFDVGIQYNSKWRRSAEFYAFFRLSATPYYFFDRESDGSFSVKDNWFINASIGSWRYEGMPMFGKEITLGLGYLVAEKGGYFKNATMKVFTDVVITNNIAVCPEFIFTDNLSQIFPGITLKVL